MTVGLYDQRDVEKEREDRALVIAQLVKSLPCKY